MARKAIRMQKYYHVLVLIFVCYTVRSAYVSVAYNFRLNNINLLKFGLKHTFASPPAYATFSKFPNPIVVNKTIVYHGTNTLHKLNLNDFSETEVQLSTGNISCIALFDENSKSLFITYSDRQCITIYDLAEDKEENCENLEELESGVFVALILSYPEKANNFLLYSTAGQLIELRASTGSEYETKILKSINDIPGKAISMAFSPNGKRILFATTEGVWIVYPFIKFASKMFMTSSETVNDGSISNATLVKPAGSVFLSEYVHLIADAGSNLLRAHDEAIKAVSRVCGLQDGSIAVDGDDISNCKIGKPCFMFTNLFSDDEVLVFGNAIAYIKYKASGKETIPDDVPVERIRMFSPVIVVVIIIALSTAMSLALSVTYIKFRTQILEGFHLILARFKKPGEAETDKQLSQNLDGSPEDKPLAERKSSKKTRTLPKSNQELEKIKVQVQW